MLTRLLVGLCDKLVKNAFSLAGCSSRRFDRQPLDRACATSQLDNWGNQLSRSYRVGIRGLDPGDGRPSGVRNDDADRSDGPRPGEHPKHRATGKRED
jgi:hypothetical protein